MISINPSRTPRAVLLIMLIMMLMVAPGYFQSTGVATGAVAAPMDDNHPAPLAIGSAAPDFRLPGVDGKTYSLASFKDSKVLVVIFTAVHCPTAEVYENRIKKLVADYRERGVAFVVIQPNSPKALRLDEMGYTDLGDSLEEMKARAAYRRFNFPFLYDGETQAASRLYGPTATPHVFVFDQQRKLRYQGRVDSNPREAYAKVADARNALDAVLAGSSVAVEKTPAVGCSIKWLDKEALQNEETQSIEREPVPLEKIGVEGMRALRKNTTGKTVLVNFWATWCVPCIAEIPAFNKLHQDLGAKGVAVVGVAMDEEGAERVRPFLKKHPIDYAVALGNEQLKQQFKTDDGLPVTVVYDRTGKEIKQFRGGIVEADLRAAVDAAVR